MKVLPVVLCGGSGTRLWPLSRSMYPKQLLPLASERSLLEDTVLRLAAVGLDTQDPLVLCNEAHRFLVAGQLERAGIAATLVLEPAGRNTAPAAAIAALWAAATHGEDTLLLVLPADHAIRNADALGAAVRAAAPAAGRGMLMTFGIVPDRPETGYGYIRALPGEGAWLAVERFVEKPDVETAQRYLQSGEFYWNSGMFLFAAGRYLAELGRHKPSIVTACRAALDRSERGHGFITLDAKTFGACESDSIDYAVMERTDNAGVVPFDGGWSDVGSWAALHEIAGVDGDGNVTSGDVVAVDCTGSYLRSESRLLGVVGLDGCVVVETKDAVLVATRDRAQDVKRLVDELESRGREEVRFGREVFRPWGSFDSLESAPGYQVKRLAVLPGAVLSLQMHHHRAEHWVVVSGTARITRDDEVFELARGGHTFIPVEARHRIENPGDTLLQIIEVQIGDYLGEDDIVRFEDNYGRQGRTD